jgi:hypothetical protein
MPSNKKMYGDKFTNDRRLAWVRSVCQARYRGEVWNLTFAEFCRFWPTEEQFHRRGRKPEDLVLTRWDNRGSWSRSNCCIITRYNQLQVSRCLQLGRDPEEFFKDAIWYGQ